MSYINVMLVPFTGLIITPCFLCFSSFLNSNIITLFTHLQHHVSWIIDLYKYYKFCKPLSSSIIHLSTFLPIVQILAEEAALVEELDLAAARDILSKAQSAASTASSEEAKAEALITVEVAEELVKAAESG